MDTGLTFPKKKETFFFREREKNLPPIASPPRRDCHVTEFSLKYRMIVCSMMYIEQQGIVP